MNKKELPTFLCSRDLHLPATLSNHLLNSRNEQHASTLPPGVAGQLVAEVNIDWKEYLALGTQPSYTLNIYVGFILKLKTSPTGRSCILCFCSMLNIILFRLYTCSPAYRPRTFDARSRTRTLNSVDDAFVFIWFILRHSAKAPA